jgi:hypothetical protein
MPYMLEITKVFEVDDIFSFLSCITTLAKLEVRAGYLQRGSNALGRKIGK